MYLCPGMRCTADFIWVGKPMLLGMAKTMITDFIGTGSPKVTISKGSVRRLLCGGGECGYFT